MSESEKPQETPQQAQPPPWIAARAQAQEVEAASAAASTARAQAGYWGQPAMRERLAQLEQLLREAPSDPRVGEWARKTEDLRKRLAQEVPPGAQDRSGTGRT